VLTIVVALLFGAAVGGLFGLTHLVHSVAGAVTPAVVAALGTAVLLVRRIGKRVTPLVEETQRHLAAGRRELALKALRSGLEHRHWHPLLAGQLRAQIGALHYAAGELDAAVSELEHASPRPWESRAFLGCAYFKRRDEAKMRRAFETAVRVGKKDSLSWTVYAWCLLARGKRPEAQAVLERGLKRLADDARLKTNLELVKEGKRLKVAPYGERWARFALDGSVPGVPKAARGFAQRPGFRQKPIRK
jgi:Flp pilus assembly protein TadD